MLGKLTRAAFCISKRAIALSPAISLHGARLFSQHIRVPEDQLDISFVRSPGPGGQNVNKVNTKAEVRFNVYLATWLPENVKERFLTLEKNNINGRGEFVITSSEERFQDKNRAIALRKLQEKVDRACAEPKKRKLKTDVDPLVKKKWVEDKRRRSELKQKRKGKEGG
ncbi:hypothetical protein WA577_004587, partial [Blastocystis sp. JDR]